MSYRKTIDAFAEKHGGLECPNYPVSDWKTAVRRDETILGYWEWAWWFAEGDDT